MIRFLMQHALALNSREDTRGENLSYQETLQYTIPVNDEELRIRSRITQEIIHGAKVPLDDTWN